MANARKETQSVRPVSPIRALIKERRLTYASIAAEIGITSAAVSAIVHGQTRGATARYSLARVLGVTVSDLWPT